MISPALPRLPYKKTPGCLGLRDATSGEVVILQISIAPMSGYSLLKTKGAEQWMNETTVCLDGDPESFCLTTSEDTD
jgi:hypothetical protein